MLAIAPVDSLSGQKRPRRDSAACLAVNPAQSTAFRHVVRLRRINIASAYLII
jgi:hypothetical protein